MKGRGQAVQKVATMATEGRGKAVIGRGNAEKKVTDSAETGSEEGSEKGSERAVKKGSERSRKCSERPRKDSERAVKTGSGRPRRGQRQGSGSHQLPRPCHAALLLLLQRPRPAAAAAAVGCDSGPSCCRTVYICCMDCGALTAAAAVGCDRRCRLQIPHGMVHFDNNNLAKALPRLLGS